VCDLQQYCWKKMVVVGGAGAGGVKKNLVKKFVCDRKKVFHSESEKFFAQE